MTINEFAQLATEVIREEKETFQEYIEKEDWSSFEDEIYECLANCD